MTSDQTHNQSPEPIVTSASEEGSQAYFAYVGINEAARLVGKGKQQIYRDIAAQKLSWHISSDGKKTLQIAELDRVYKVKPQAVTGNVSGHQNQKLPAEKPSVITPANIETAIELARLQERLTAKDEALKKAEEQIRDLQQNRDKLIEQNNRLTLLLPAPKPEPVTVAPEPEKKRPWWSFGQ